MSFYAGLGDRTCDLQQTRQRCYPLDRLTLLRIRGTFDIYLILDWIYIRPSLSSPRISLKRGVSLIMRNSPIQILSKHRTGWVGSEIGHSYLLKGHRDWVEG